VFRMMKRTIGLGVGAVLIALIAGCELRPHTEDTMLSGSHIMSTPMSTPQRSMPDRVMPSHSRDCTERALAAMPPEHRQACLSARGSR
jgi:hypothetical protein